MLASVSNLPSFLLYRDARKLPVEQVLAKLTVQPAGGLSSSEAQQRLAEFDPQCLSRKRRLDDGGLSSSFARESYALMENGPRLAPPVDPRQNQ